LTLVKTLLVVWDSQRVVPLSGETSGVSGTIHRACASLVVVATRRAVGQDRA